MPDISLVIPVHNEAENIGALLDSVAEHVGVDCEALICYDFDEDNTLPVARGYQSRFERMRFVKNAYGRGPLGAIRSGFEEASGAAVIVVMADLSDDLPKVPRMVELFHEGCAVVAASRYMRGGRQIGGPWLKKTLSRLAGVSLYYLAGLPTHDATNSFRLYSKELLDSVKIESTGGFEVALELTVKAHLRGMRIAEVPATWLDRTAGKSRFRLWQWLPHYLRWYRAAISGRLRGRGKRRPANE